MWKHPFRPLGRYPAHSVLSRFHESSGVINIYIYICDYKYVYICILIHTYIEYLYTVCSKIGPKGVASKHHYTLFGMVSDTGFTTLIGKYFFSWESLCHWIGLRENRNRKPWFLPLNMEVSCKISLKPIQWLWVGNDARTDYGIPAALRPYKFPLERFAATCRAIRVAAPRIRWWRAVWRLGFAFADHMVV